MEPVKTAADSRKALFLAEGTHGFVLSLIPTVRKQRQKIFVSSRLARAIQ